MLYLSRKTHISMNFSKVFQCVIDIGYRKLNGKVVDNMHTTYYVFLLLLCITSSAMRYIMVESDD